MPVKPLGSDGAYSAQFYTSGLQDECVENAIEATESVQLVCGGGDEEDGEGDGEGEDEQGEGD